MEAKKKSLIEKFKSPDFKIVEHGRYYWIVPAAIVLLAVVVMFISNFGFKAGYFNLGLDFTGGTIIKIENAVDIETKYDTYVKDIEEILNANGITKSQFQREHSDAGKISMTVKYQDKSGLDDAGMEELNATIKDAIKVKIAGSVIEDADRISASASSEKLLSAFIAVVVAMLGILIYMAFRFKLTSGIAAVIGLLHDVIILTALVAIFRIQINSTFIAVLITIVGYSINNNLILFDRVREYERNPDNRASVAQRVNQSIKDTFTRTMNTTITTLVPVFVLAFIGVPLIREFAIPVLFGLLAGTYSTIFIITVLYTRFESHKIYARKYKEKQAKSVAS